MDEDDLFEPALTTLWTGDLVFGGVKPCAVRVQCTSKATPAGDL